MEFSHLSEKDLAIECSIRGIPFPDDTAMLRLSQLYQAELADPKLVPIASHADKNPKSEIRSLVNKIDKLKQDLNSAPIRNVIEQGKYRSLVLHVLGRVLRLSGISSVKIQVDKLRLEAEDLLHRVEVAQVNSHVETSPLQSPIISPSGRAFTASTGTVPKIIATNITDSRTAKSSTYTDKVCTFLDNSQPREQFGSNRYSSLTQSPPLVNLERSQPRNLLKSSFELNTRTPEDDFLGFSNTNNNISSVSNSFPVTVAAPLITREASQPQSYSVGDRRGSPTRSPMFKWKLVFDGTSGLDVSEFLFRVDSLASLERVSNANLCAGFHTLVAGRAATWYWLFLRIKPNPTWPELRAALLREFRSQDTDYEIRKLIENRRQGPRESFSDFRLAVHGMVAKMHLPIPEVELIEILRRNMKPALQEALLLYSVNSILDLRDICNRFEKLWSEIGAPREAPVRRAVHELYSDSPSLDNQFVSNNADTLDALHSNSRPLLWLDHTLYLDPLVSLSVGIVQ